MGPGPDWAVMPADEDERDAVRTARIETALRAGWQIRQDLMRGEFTAARELRTGKTIDELLDAIEAADR